MIEGDPNILTKFLNVILIPSFPEIFKPTGYFNFNKYQSVFTGKHVIYLDTIDIQYGFYKSFNIYKNASKFIKYLIDYLECEQNIKIHDSIKIEIVDKLT